jgi:hypothetical protein
MWDFLGEIIETFLILYEPKKPKRYWFIVSTLMLIMILTLILILILKG